MKYSCPAIPDRTALHEMVKLMKKLFESDEQANALIQRKFVKDDVAQPIPPVCASVDRYNPIIATEFNPFQA